MKLSELLIVFGIFSITAMSSIGIINSLPQARLKAASFKIYSLFVEARSLALRQGCNYAVVIEEKPDGHYFTLVKDTNYNGVCYREYLSGRDAEIGKGIVLEKEYPGVYIKKIAFSSKHVISFSPYFTSSNGSIYLKTKNPDDGVFRLKVYGKSFVVKPVKIFPDGSEVKYE
ncbi:pilus assembly FimT family protein [Thermotomaculum hydrothermale]|nr:hypothetical protein [Thermotomaculum hydrothermale]